jgi:hypothetical protein
MVSLPRSEEPAGTVVATDSVSVNVDYDNGSSAVSH